MDPETFAFYLKTSPAEYAPRGREIPPCEQILTDLQALHGDRRAHEMGLAFLAQELRAYLFDSRVLPLATDAWRIDPDSSPLFPRITDANGQEIITVSSIRPPAEVTAIARLIAAAPRLLRACQEVLTRLDLEAAERPGAIFPAAALRGDLRAAIAQATGEEVQP